MVQPRPDSPQPHVRRLWDHHVPEVVARCIRGALGVAPEQCGLGPSTPEPAPSSLYPRSEVWTRWGLGSVRRADVGGRRRTLTMAQDGGEAEDPAEAHPPAALFQLRLEPGHPFRDRIAGLLGPAVRRRP